MIYSLQLALSFALVVTAKTLSYVPGMGNVQCLIKRCVHTTAFEKGGRRATAIKLRKTVIRIVNSSKLAALKVGIFASYSAACGMHS